MQTWPIQDAKARFSEFLDACISDGPQMVSKRGVDAAVLVPLPVWQRMQATSRMTLKELLLSEHVHFIGESVDLQKHLWNPHEQDLVT